MDAQTLRRLALIKYFFKIGVEQSRRPEPLCFISVLTFQDAIELFLQLSSEKHNVGTARTGFMEYFDILKPQMPDNQDLSQKESVRRLNSARVAFKHHGTLPSSGDIEAFRGAAWCQARFLERQHIGTPGDA